MKWTEAPHWVRVVHLMQSFRGSWSGGRETDRLPLIYSEIELAKAEGLVPLEWLRAVQLNADAFDGEFRDGRIFRDGASYVPASVAISFGFPKTSGDPEGMVSVSGNAASWLPGHTRRQVEGFYGSYTEEPGNSAPILDDCPSDDCLAHEGEFSEEQHA